jgi:hypothetical protein
VRCLKLGWAGEIRVVLHVKLRKLEVRFHVKIRLVFGSKLL